MRSFVTLLLLLFSFKSFSNDTLKVFVWGDFPPGKYYMYFNTSNSNDYTNEKLVWEKKFNKETYYREYIEIIVDTSLILDQVLPLRLVFKNGIFWRNANLLAINSECCEYLIIYTDYRVKKKHLFSCRWSNTPVYMPGLFENGFN